MGQEYALSLALICTSTISRLLGSKVTNEPRLSSVNSSEISTLSSHDSYNIEIHNKYCPSVSCRSTIELERCLHCLSNVATLNLAPKAMLDLTRGLVNSSILFCMFSPCNIGVIGYQFLHDTTRWPFTL